MKGLLQLCLLGMLLLLLTGCPYDSIIALCDTRTSEIDTLLLGKWIGNDIRDDSDTVELNILKFNSNEYIIDFKEIQINGEINRALLRGFTTIIDNKKILNINELGRDIEYTFFRYEIEGPILKVAFASDDIIKNDFYSEEKLYNFFVKHINNKGFFEEDIIFRKAK